MTRNLRVSVLAVLFALGGVAGPIEDQPKTLPVDALSNGLTTYQAFLALAGPVWLLGSTPATFDSVMHYAPIAVAPPSPFDPLSEEFSAVPEPRPVALLAFGLAVLALLGLRRRRRTHSHDL